MGWSGGDKMLHNQFIDLQENVKHGDFMLPFAQYVSWVPWSFTSFPMHWHKEVEFIYVESGICEINIDLQQYVLKEGDIVIVSPYALHSLKQYRKEHACVVSWVFDVNMLTYGVTDGCYVKYLKPFMDGKYEYPKVVHWDFPVYEELRELLTGIHQVCDAKESCMELDIKWRLEKIFYVLVKKVFKRKDELGKEKQETISNVKIVVDYIHENYQNQITIGELADLLHFSEPYFMRFFKKYTGTTCVAYINEFRMNKAAELLIGTDLSVMEVAMQVGMHNISYFNRMFKNKYDITPKEYRKKRD